MALSATEPTLLSGSVIKRASVLYINHNTWISPCFVTHRALPHSNSELFLEICWIPYWTDPKYFEMHRTFASQFRRLPGCWFDISKLCVLCQFYAVRRCSDIQDPVLFIKSLLMVYKTTKQVGSVECLVRKLSISYALWILGCHCEWVLISRNLITIKPEC